MDKIFLAVYGTLRVGDSNYYRFLLNSPHVGTFRVKGFNLYTNGGFPYALRGNGEIVVDLFEISRRTFIECDRLEGYPSHYTRQLIDIEGVMSWIYLAAKPAYVRGLDLVESGDWNDVKDDWNKMMERRALDDEDPERFLFDYWVK